MEVYAAHHGLCAWKDPERPSRALLKFLGTVRASFSLLQTLGPAQACLSPLVTTPVTDLGVCGCDRPRLFIHTFIQHSENICEEFTLSQARDGFQRDQRTSKFPSLLDK